VMNLSASNTANITVYYYAKSSGSLVTTVTDTIGVGGVKTYYPPIDSDLDGSFDGSIIVTSNRKIAAMAYSTRLTSHTTWEQRLSKAGAPPPICH